MLLAGGPMTRAQLGEQTGLSKVTASQLLGRLEERGLVRAAGELAGGRGPNAALYGVVPSAAYVAGLHVERDEVSAAVAAVTGNLLAEVSVDPNGDGDPVGLVRGAVLTACGTAGASPDALRAFVIGTPGVLDPVTGEPRLAVNLPAWHGGVLVWIGVGAQAVLPLAASFGFARPAAGQAVHAAVTAAAAGDRRAGEFLGELAGRVATGVWTADRCSAAPCSPPSTRPAGSCSPRSPPPETH